jgi:2-oxoglutarate ferredoxin oxidoreductase subunit delta
MAGKVIIDMERCKGCGLCVAFCPRGCIVISGKSNKNGYFPAQADSTNCTGCASCALVCPDAVIEIYQNDISNKKQKGKESNILKNTAVKTLSK